MECKYCSKQVKNKVSKAAHEGLCKQNPDRRKSPFENLEWQKSKGINQYIKAAKLGLEKPVRSEETRQKLSNAQKGKKHTDEYKKLMSEHAKKNNLGGVTQSRWIQYNGKTLGSTYEFELVKDLERCDIEWNTCKKFNYIDNKGKARTYTPDIYLPEYDIYLDPKNDYLIENVNPNLGFKDCEKIDCVMKQNNVIIHILNKSQLTWEYIKTLLKHNR
jgi:hypothetical protein